MLSSNVPPCFHISLLYIMGFGIKITYSRIQALHLHASRCHHCHYCKVDFVLFHNVTCYTNSLLSHIHVNIANLLNIVCTLVAIAVILGRLECTLTFSKYISSLCQLLDPHLTAYHSTYIGAQALGVLGFRV